MSKVVGLIHATIVAVRPMREMFTERLPQVRVLNFLDEGIRKRLNETGSITPEILRRMENLALLTCSAFSPTVDLVQKMVDIPVLKIDEMMIEKAVEKAERIGMIATAAKTYQSTQDRIYEVACREGKKVSIQPILVEEAFDALLSGKTDLHDELIASKMRALSQSSDVIVLA